MNGIETKSIEEWYELLYRRNKGSFQGLCEEILSEIDGYGVEYGFDTKVDAENLANAFQALKKLLQVAKSISPS